MYVGFGISGEFVHVETQHRAVKIEVDALAVAARIVLSAAITGGDVEVTVIAKVHVSPEVEAVWLGLLNQHRLGRGIRLVRVSRLHVEARDAVEERPARPDAYRVPHKEAALSHMPGRRVVWMKRHAHEPTVHGRRKHLAAPRAQR